jgi:hypothetical protein
MENLVNIDEFEKLLISHWTKFINPQKLIALVLTHVRDTNLIRNNTSPPIQKKAIQVTLTQFRATLDGFIIWVDFVIPKEKGLAIGTCELRMCPITGELRHLQTLGNIFTG